MSKVLTIVICDPSPFIFMQEPASHRTVRITLTEGQLARIDLKQTGTNCGHPVFEHVSQCFLEEENVNSKAG